MKLFLILSLLLLVGCASVTPYQGAVKPTPKDQIIFSDDFESWGIYE